MRSMNAGSIYYQPPRPERKELLLVLYVDDIMLIGRKSDQLSFYAQLNARFQCKPVQWLEDRAICSGKGHTTCSPALSHRLVVVVVVVVDDHG